LFFKTIFCKARHLFHSPPGRKIERKMRTLFFPAKFAKTQFERFFLRIELWPFKIMDDGIRPKGARSLTGITTLPKKLSAYRFWVAKILELEREV
jgi:hypothetical protein